MEDLISVIVPVYMVQDYLPACIESIINQTYKNIEIILIDDGSKDESGKICDYYKNKDSRIQVVHKENNGLSVARNIGINEANGNYILFVDSDDTIKPQMIEFLYKPIKDGLADISVCKFKRVTGNENSLYKMYDYCKPVLISNHEERTDYFFGEDTRLDFTVVWNKLYPISYFKNVRFPIGKIHEDEFVSYKLLEKASKVAYFNIPLYNYVIRNNSITGTSFKKENIDLFEAYSERIEHYLEIGQYDWTERILFLYKKMLVGAARNVYITKQFDYSLIEGSVNNLSTLLKKSINKLPIDTKRKMIYTAFMLFPKTYIKLKMLF